MNFIGEFIPDGVNAGSKARQDVEHILEEIGERLITLQREKFLLKSVFVKRQREQAIQLFKISLSNNEPIVIQYPSSGWNRVDRFCLRRILRKRNVILFVHDIDPLRQDHLKLSKDLRLLDMAKVIILHNKSMIAKVREEGVKTPAVPLELFDYLIPEKEIGDADVYFGSDIAFAGNLEKSSFLQKTPEGDCGFHFHLYGAGLPERLNQNPNVTWMGTFSPEEIPRQIRGSFGLIWDGDSWETCIGEFGRYLRYNNPHKLSLYIVAGLPVITWEDAAIAAFIHEHDIGFTVHSLSEIPDKIAKLTLDDYERFRTNLADLRTKALGGYFTKQALGKAETIIRQREE